MGLMSKHHAAASRASEELLEYRYVERYRLWLSILVTGLVMVLEVAGGIITGSLALVSDAGHMFTHLFALSLSLAAILIAGRPACHHRTFGFYRAEILAAFLNGLFLLAVTGWILYESIMRMLHPVEVQEMQMLVVAVLGLIANLVSAVLLHGTSRTDMNVRSAFLHMLADTLSSVAVIIGALVIHVTKWSWIDPVLSAGIALVILRWGWDLLSDSTHILLEGAPKGLTSDMVEKLLLEAEPGIRAIEDIHLWTITSEMFYLTARIALKRESSMEEMRRLRERIRELVSSRFGIGHVIVEFD